MKAAFPDAIKVKGPSPGKTPDWSQFKQIGPRAGKTLFHKDYEVNPATGRICGHTETNKHHHQKHINIKLANGKKGKYPNRSKGIHMKRDYEPAIRCLKLRAAELAAQAKSRPQGKRELEKELRAINAAADPLGKACRNGRWSFPFALPGCQFRPRKRQAMNIVLCVTTKAMIEVSGRR